MPLFFPTLIGLTFNFIRRPKGSTSIQTQTTGREGRVGYWTFPLYEWELSYDYLGDTPRTPALYPSFLQIVGDPPPSATINSEIRRLQGFYLAMQGPLTPFYFLDPNDFFTIGQPIAIADGTETSFRVVRTTGDPGAEVTTPVGLVNEGAAFTLNVFLNGILQTKNTDYTITGEGAGDAFVTFTNPPPADVAITMDVGHFFYVHFKDDQAEFTKFADKFWMVRKLTLESLRPELIPAPVP
jgi:uncharacterized protein (TIGR02217 family)